MADSKLQIIAGNINFTAEGTEAWITRQYDSFLDRLETLSSAVQPTSDAIDSPPPPGANPKDHQGLSINSLAARVKVSNVSELIVAACFSLTQGEKETCTRQELLEEMKRATNYYKASVVKNLTSYLKTVTTSQRLNEQSSGVYALPASVRAELQAKLA